MFRTVSYFYDIFVRFILFLSLYLYHFKYNFVRFIFMNLQLDEKSEKICLKCIKHVQVWGKREGESCWKLNQVCSGS